MSAKSETVADDWEDIDDSVLDSKVEQLKMTSKSPLMSAAENSRPFSLLLLNDDDSMRTPYTPPEPTVKILKRPTNDRNSLQFGADAKPKAPIKTLQQREQEYAEARLRILGSAKSPEDEEEESANYKNGTTNGFNLDSNTNRTFVPRNNSNPSLNTSRTTFGRIYSQPSQPVPELRRIEDNVIRLPRGPDGSAGFLLKR